MIAWVDTWDTSSVKHGPIRTATELSGGAMLDRSAKFALRMLAADPRSAYIAEKYVAAIRGIVGGSTVAIGQGVIDQITVSGEPGSETISAGGNDLLQELTYPLVDGLEISEIQWLTPNMFQLEQAGSGTTNLTNTLDGNAATHNTVTMSTYPMCYLYCVHATQFTKIHLDLGTFNGVACTLVAQYFKNQTEGWVSLAIADGTAVAGATLAQDGDITFVAPSDWTQVTNGGYYGYTVRLYLGAVGLLDAVDINEVTVWAAGPTTAGLTLLAPYLPAGWSFAAAPYYSVTQSRVYHKFEAGSNTTVLAALIWLGENCSPHEHWRLGAVTDTTREIDWLQDDQPSSGLRAVDAWSPRVQTNDSVVLLLSIERTQDSAETYNRIYPTGAGHGSLRVDLAVSTWTPPAGHAINRTLNYIEKNGSSPRISRAVSLGDIGSIDAAGVGDIQAANQLAQSAYAELALHDTTAQFYRATVTKLPKLLKPGETIRVVHRKVYGSYVAIDIDADLLIMGVEHRLDEQGMLTADLELATVARYPVTNTTVALRQMQAGTQARATGNPVSEPAIRAALGAAGLSIGAGTSGIIQRQTIRTREGEVAAGSDEVGVPNETGVAQTITKVRLDTSVAVVGAAVVVDVLVAGVSIFTDVAHRPQIAVGATTGNTTTIDLPAWAANALLTTEVISAGTASGLMITIVHEGAL